MIMRAWSGRSWRVRNGDYFCSAFVFQLTRKQDIGERLTVVFQTLSAEKEFTEGHFTND